MPAEFPAPISQEELETLFPLTREPIQEKCFEIGLTLGGTVSAGAYTAGVLDYLIEALDAWTRAKEDRREDAPTHNTVISVLAGASGGAINSAIFTRLSGWSFPHGPVPENPFYDLWVNGVDLAKLLSVAPEPGVSGFAAIFNTAAFSILAESIIKKTGAVLGSNPSSPRHRAYLADPLRLFMTVANVTGVPYRIHFRGQSGLAHDLISHGDFMRSGVTVPGGVPNPPGIRQDEIALVCGDPANWELLADTALATCAFPAAFRSRPLTRALSMMGYRVVAVPGEAPDQVEVAQLIPCWEAMGDDSKQSGKFRTVNVDGGTLNNEPLDFTRIALAGLNGRNKREGTEANRAVILIDPFSDHEDISLFDPPNFLDLIGPLISTLTQQARYKPQDIALSTDYDTYSKFLVAPYGPGSDGALKSGCKVIASGGLGGFLGFVNKKFLDYDFRLGRRNAYEFLLKEFVLPGTNPLFRDTWTTKQLQTYHHADRNPITDKEVIFLPIVPLMRELRENPPQELTAADWPRLAEMPSQLKPQVEARLNAIYETLKHEKWWPDGGGSFAADVAWRTFLRGLLRDAFVGKISDALHQQKLVEPTK